MGQTRRVTLSRGNRAEVTAVLHDSHAFVEKRLLDFANVSTERTALYYEALLQKASAGPGVVPIIDERLSHVTRLREADEVPDELEFFKRHYVHGFSLRELSSPVLRHHLTRERSILWIARIAQVLHRVHALPSLGGEPLGLIHRDVTWDNILVDENELGARASGDGVFLNDFGLAHVKSWGALSLDESLQGARWFLSPELKAGGQPSPASDVYQAALTLCFLLSAHEGKNAAALFDVGLGNPVSERARAVLRPLGAETALDEAPGNRPTALELSALLSK